MEVIKLTEGETGESIRQFVDNEVKKATEKERQQIEREEQAREREERAKVEENTRELEKKEIERQQKEEAHKRDLKKQEKERELLRKEKEEEHRRELEKRDKDMKMIKLKMTMGKDQAEGVAQTITIHRRKLPKFEEDNMDTYLQHFERFAKMQKWKTEE